MLQPGSDLEDIMPTARSIYYVAYWEINVDMVTEELQGKGEGGQEGNVVITKRKGGSLRYQKYSII